MEIQEESRAHDVDEMAIHLLTLRNQLNDMQSEAEQKDVTTAETTEQALQEMHQVQHNCGLISTTCAPAF